ncbi:AtpZ/AtpI family protein [Patescibacteria group bacterium]|nr:AtpZ/AtpI family protein [Patescibacteria group bacterium]
MPPLKSSPGVPPIQALGYVGELLFAIIIPTVLCAWGGRWLDQRYDFSPFGTIAGLFLALVLVAVIISKKAEELREIFYPKSK